MINATITVNGSINAARANWIVTAAINPSAATLTPSSSGAAHFDVPAETGMELIRELQAQLPGYLVPKLVREIPGQKAKTPVG